MEIRKATRQDHKSVMKLLEQIAKLHCDGRPDIFKKASSKYTKEQFVELLSDENTPVFVAIENQIIVGYAFCKFKFIKNHNMLVDKTTLYIDDLCVDETIRGHGIGKQLFLYIKEFAKNSGCDNIDLNVWELNERAMKFYEKCGMTVQKRHLELIL